MGTQAKHTPTPWKPFYYGTEIRPCCNPSEILVTTDIESRAAIKISDKERAANIEFIVKACNSHDALVEALDGLVANINLKKLNIKKDFELILYHATAVKVLGHLSTCKPLTS